MLLKTYVDVLFNKKIIRDKTKRIQSKLHKLELMKFVKFLYLVLMIKDTY